MFLGRIVKDVRLELLECGEEIGHRARLDDLDGIRSVFEVVRQIIDGRSNSSSDSEASDDAKVGESGEDWLRF